MTKPKTGSKRENPLASLTWLWDTKPPPSNELPPSNEHDKLKPLKFKRHLEGEFIPEQPPEKYGYLRLTFDSGLRDMVESFSEKTQIARKQKSSGEPQRHGWAGQFAFDSYLNFFAKAYEDYNLSVHSDNPIYSKKPEPQDFIIKRPNHKLMRIEIKTAPPSRRKISYCKYSGKPDPTHLVVIKAVDDSMLRYDIYGFMSVFRLKTLRTYFMYGKVCSTILLNRHNFRYFNHFHEKVLGLPYLEKFSD